MGVVYYANAVIGVRISDPRVNTKYRGCRHAEFQSNFCPECGQKMWKHSNELHPILNAIENDGNYKLVWSTDKKEVIVGVHATYTDSSRLGGDFGLASLPENFNVKELKANLQKDLKELYNEGQFGLWSVLYCSY